MNGIVRAVILTLPLGLNPVMVLGQKKLPPPPPPPVEDEEPEHRHKTLPAWKSVEVGDYYLMKKVYRAALSRYQDAIQADPTYPRSYLGMGKVYDRLGLRQKALENYQKYLDLLPSAKDAEEAHAVHKAIARLHKKLKSAPAPKPPQSAVGSEPSSD